jgi:transposase InsO family protein
MIPHAMRTLIRQWLKEAVDAGARLGKALLIIGLTARCLQRWRDDDVDLRTTRVQPPHNALSDAARAQVLEVMNSSPFAALPPTQIVPILADQGRYVASESTMYRILRQAQQLTHRASTRRPQVRTKPKAIATQPNQVATWDITYLPSAIRGRYWYAYVVLDVFSRKAVAWQVYVEESQQAASDLIEDYVAREGIGPGRLTLHADNGAVMKGQTLYACLQRLDVAPSHSRAGMSDDNPFIESLFKTIKYRPTDPLVPFATLEAARAFMDRLLHWYNETHRHSGIHYVTPSQRHAGEDIAILERRHALYQAAKAKHPERWSGKTRDWRRKTQITLNPDRMEEKREKPVRSQVGGLSCPLIHRRQRRRRIGPVRAAPMRRESVDKWSA